MNGFQLLLVVSCARALIPGVGRPKTSIALSAAEFHGTGDNSGMSGAGAGK